MEIGVLGFQGSVAEHIAATKEAARKLGISCRVSDVRTSAGLERLDGLIIPGGESTTMYKLCEREGMLERMREVPALFGTCAGAILLAKKIHNEEEGQKTLGLMDIVVERNAYGTQTESFEENLEVQLGPPDSEPVTMSAIFIRAPKIRSAGENVTVLANRGGEIVACGQREGGRFYLAACFHPELSTTLIHEHFLRRLLSG
ncbi:pyridoxal 5'-phosphate synthase glutaminase subunit PdxT [Candidatus Micrarchaeota archaeon]|nr:pyridoxal 5'-phosphate synthase glutaminase subunit PdxT [Candidatus Micrarchaeota archaeon]